jgi:hypothetical protein
MNSHLILVMGVALALLVFVLTCLCLHGSLSRHWKTALVLLSTVAYMGLYTGMRETQGWAAAETLPPRFALLAAVIEEPVKDKTKGEIFVWLQPMQDNRPSGEPRAYRLAYDKGLHSLFDEGVKKTKRGNTQMGTAEPRVGPRGFSWFRPSGNETLQIRLRDLPASQLPEK